MAILTNYVMHQVLKNADNFDTFPGGSFIYSDNLYNAKNMYCFMYHSEFILRLMQSLMKRLLFSCLLT